MSTKKFNPNWLWLLVPVMFIIGIIVFLSTEECYQQFCITGWEVLKIQWPSFWLFAIGGLLVGVILLILAYWNETGKGWIGKKLQGNTGLTILFVALALLVICGPWGRACTDKSNGGVTAPGHKVEQPAP